jgi:hypothetical protein
MTPAERLKKVLDRLESSLVSNLIEENERVYTHFGDLLRSSFNEEERAVIRSAVLRLESNPLKDQILSKLSIAPKDKLAVGDRVVTSDGYHGVVEQLAGPRCVTVRYHRGYVASEDPSTLRKEIP